MYSYVYGYSCNYTCNYSYNYSYIYSNLVCKVPHIGADLGIFATTR